MRKNTLIKKHIIQTVYKRSAVINVVSIYYFTSANLNEQNLCVVSSFFVLCCSYNYHGKEQTSTTNQK